MRKIFILLIISLSSIFYVKSQAFLSFGGEMSITTYISGPNRTGTMMAKEALKEGFVNINTVTIPVFGIKIENLRPSGWSYTFEANYTFAKTTFSIPNFEGNYDVTGLFPQNRILFGSNYHFNKSNKFDWYAGSSLGYHNGAFYTKLPNEWKYSGTNSELMHYLYNRYIDEMTKKFDLVDLPISLRLQLGTNIFFSKHFGINLEIGAFGGGIIKGGAVVKI